MTSGIHQHLVPRSVSPAAGFDMPTDLLHVRYAVAERHHRLAAVARRRRLSRRPDA
jgi:hypothetical protein